MAIPVALSFADQSVTIRIVDGTAFTPEEGVTSATAGLALWYRKGALGTVAAITESDLGGVDSAHSDGGMIHLDDGYYRVDLPDAANPTIENEVTVVGGTATDMIVHGAALVGVQPIGAAGAGLSNISLPATGLDLILKTSTFALAMADAVWDEVLTGATHNVASSAGKRLRLLGAASIANGTAEAGAAATITLEEDAVSTTDHIYNQNLIAIVGGTGAGQVRMIVEYVGSTRVVTVDEAWQTTPDVTSEYQIIAFNGILLAQHGQAAAGTASTITLSATALTDDASYVGSVVFITTGTGAGQARLITAYVGSTKVATVSPDWETTPSTDSVYKILPVGRSIVESLAADAANMIADHTIRRSFENACDSGDGDTKSFRSLLGAMAKLVNKIAVSGTTLTVYEDDDTTSLGTQAVTTDASADPIIGLDT